MKSGSEAEPIINKAGYTAQDAPSTRLKITRDRRTDRRTDGQTDTTSYRDATAHLKIFCFFKVDVEAMKHFAIKWKQKQKL